VIDAAVRGAWEAGVSVGAILVQTIAFISLIMFVDAGLSWFFARVGVQLDIAVSLSLSHSVSPPPSLSLSINQSNNLLFDLLLIFSV